MPTQRYGSRHNRSPNSEAAEGNSIFGASDGKAWQAHGSCAQPGADPQWWFPMRGEHEAEHTRKAKEVCSQCPVRAECLLYISENTEYGIWAGYTQKDRLELGIGKRMY